MKKSLPVINQRIRVDKLQLITETGENLGVVSRTRALNTAEEAGLDLVLISEQGREGYPVGKIMDYGKELYSKKKKAADSKKNQKVIKIKELKLRPKIGDHDFDTKVKQAIQFIKAGMRVKMTLVFRGREMSNKEAAGKEIFEKINEAFSSLGSSLIMEQDSKMGQFWSKIYYLKS